MMGHRMVKHDRLSWQFDWLVRELGQPGRAENRIDIAMAFVRKDNQQPGVRPARSDPLRDQHGASAGRVHKQAKTTQQAMRRGIGRQSSNPVHLIDHVMNDILRQNAVAEPAQLATAGWLSKQGATMGIDLDNFLLIAGPLQAIGNPEE